MTPLVMGVLNVTPDSFSDGGRYLDPAAAMARGRELIAEGADIVDVGGESTRPGAAEVDQQEELRRVVPVVEALAPLVRVSVDTRKRAVAAGALGAGATLVNDVSASLHEVAAAAGAGWVAMHMRGVPATMQHEPRYRDVLTEVRDHLVARAEAARAAGVEEVWIDPGIGFGKTAGHNLTLLGHVAELVGTGFPVVIGTSRKAFLGELLARSDRVQSVAVEDRLEGSLATATWAMLAGVGMIRTHDVRATVHAAAVVSGPMPAAPAAGVGGRGAS